MTWIYHYRFWNYFYDFNGGV